MFSKSFLIISGALAGILIIVVLVILPLWQGTINSRQSLVSEKNLLEKKQNLIFQIKSLSDKFQQSQDKVKKINFAIPRDQSVAELLVQFESIAAENGMVLNTIDFSEQAPAASFARQEDFESEIQPQSYKILSINANLKGAYPSFKNFLNAIEKNIRLMDAQSVSLSPAGEGSLFNFTVGINTYWQ